MRERERERITDTRYGSEIQAWKKKKNYFASDVTGWECRMSYPKAMDALLSIDFFQSLINILTTITGACDSLSYLGCWQAKNVLAVATSIKIV